MNKPIAVIAKSFRRAEEYLREIREIETVNKGSNRIISKDGRVYYIVTTYNHAQGMEFAGYIQVDDCDTGLFDLVKSRIK